MAPGRTRKHMRGVVWIERDRGTPLTSTSDPGGRE